MEKEYVDIPFENFPVESAYIPEVGKPIFRNLVGSFIEEACKALKMDAKGISVLSGPCPIPTLTLLAPNFDGIYINKDIKAEIIKKHSFTPLRGELYRDVRLIFIRRKSKNPSYEFSEEDQLDAFTFSLALTLLVGLSLEMFPLPMFNWDDMKARILKMLNEEFDEECVLRVVKRDKMPVPCLRICKTDEKWKEYVKRYCDRPSSEPYTLSIKEQTLGSKDNPFENIYEACDFVKSIEQKAYNEDHVLQDIAELKNNFLPHNNTYNVPWANGWITLQDNQSPDGAFLLNTLQSGRFQFKPNLYQRKFLYRGQSKFYDRCTPTMFRDDTKTYFLDDVIWNIEMRQLILSHPLENLLNQGFWMLHDPFRIEVNTYGLCQHYYGRTSLLDLTSDIKAAQFFAVTDYHRDDAKGIDTYTPHTDTCELGVLYYYEICMPNAFGFYKDDSTHLTAVGKQVFMRCGQQHGFILNVSKGIDFNTLPQVKKVFFKHNPDISQKIFEESQNGKEYFPCDALELMWKRKLKQNLYDSRVSYKTVEEDVRANKGETFDSIRRKLEDRGIQVDMTYTPSFDEDILGSYYQDIKNGWWQEEFCKDIYFAGSDGILYENALRDLPNNPDYKWAFYLK